MLRKCASIAFGLALVVALGFALAHAHALKVPGASTGFSAPCEPASPAFKAAGEAKAVSSLDWAFAADTSQATGRIARRACVESDAPPSSEPAPQAFPPLFHRPPPSAS